jgi:O-antigen/teichoic acid export membrane protein
MDVFTPQVLLMTLGLISLGAIALAVIGKSLIELVYSSAFSDAYGPMVALLPGIVFLGGAKVVCTDIVGRGYPAYNSINTGCALVITVILDIILIPRYGVTGAAIASTIAYTTIFFTAIVFYALVRRSGRREGLQFPAPSRRP